MLYGLFNFQIIYASGYQNIQRLTENDFCTFSLFCHSITGGGDLYVTFPSDKEVIVAYFKVQCQLGICLKYL
jgi:hypothetical protein